MIPPTRGTEGQMGSEKRTPEWRLLGLGRDWGGAAPGAEFSSQRSGLERWACTARPLVKPRRRPHQHLLRERSRKAGSQHKRQTETNDRRAQRKKREAGMLIALTVAVVTPVVGSFVIFWLSAKKNFWSRNLPQAGTVKSTREPILSASASGSRPGSLSRCSQNSSPFFCPGTQPRGKRLSARCWTITGGLFKPRVTVWGSSHKAEGGPWWELGSRAVYP